MSNEIVKAVAEKANISESMAKIAVDAVLNLLKDKLPPAMGGVLDSFIGSDSKSAKTTTAPKAGTAASKSGAKDDSLFGELGNIADALGGLLGKK